MILSLPISYFHLLDPIFPGEYSNAVLIGVYQPLSTRAEYPCQVTSLPVDFRQVGNGFVYQKDWPYTRLFNYHFLKVRLSEVVMIEVKGRFFGLKIS